MTYIPPISSVITVNAATADALYSNKRQLAVGNNAFSTDGGAASTITLQANSVATITGNTTLTSTSATNTYADATSGAITVTLPAASTTAKKILVKKIDSANNVTVTRAGSDTIEGSNTFVLSSQYQWIVLQSDGTSVWKIVGLTVPSTGIAPSNSQYLLLASDSNLSNSRTATAGNNVVFTDGGAGSTLTINTHKKTSVSGNTTITNTSNMVYLVDATSGAVAITLPAASNTDKTFTIKKIDSSTNAVTVTRAGSDTIDGATTYVLSVQYQSVTILADGSTSWYVL